MKRTGSGALVVLLASMVGAACAPGNKPDIIPETPPSPVASPTPTPSACTDADGDGFGEGCEAGPDCDDTAATCSSDCADANEDGVQDCNFCPDHPVEMGSVNMNDAPHAIEYQDGKLYVAAGSALEIIDVSEPATPKVLGAFPIASPCIIHDLVVDGDFVYLGLKYFCGVSVVDVSDPANPVGHDFFGNQYNYGVFKDGPALYAADDNGLLVLDASDPGDLKYVGQPAYGPYTHYVTAAADIVLTSTFDSNNPLYVGVWFWDVSDPATPTLLGRIRDLPGFPDSLNMVVDGARVYMAGGLGGLYVVDFTDPTTPVLVTRFDTPGRARDIQLTPDGLAYVADGSGGIRIIDVSDPAAPAEIGTFVSDTLDFFQVRTHAGYLWMSDGIGVRVASVRCSDQ